MDNCEIKKCRNQGDLNYLGHQVCEKCYGKHCDGKIDLKKIFNIKMVGDSECCPTKERYPRGWHPDDEKR
jgi:hypothetical protein